MNLRFLFLILLSSCRSLSGISIPTTNVYMPLDQAYTPRSRAMPVISPWVSNPGTVEERKKKIKTHDNTDLSVFFGRYISRQGILDDFGRLGPTFGAELAVFSPFTDHKAPPVNVTHGFFILWTFDHFWKTQGSLLRPELKDQDYTNYMLGGGYAFRLNLGNMWQVHYRGGLAFNFIEIDSFRQNGDLDDGKYTDITISTVHKLGFDYLVKRTDRIYREPQIRIGPSVFYYWAPDPLGKFKLRSESEGVSPGGSLAWFFEVKFEIY